MKSTAATRFALVSTLPRPTPARVRRRRLALDIAQAWPVLNPKVQRALTGIVTRIARRRL